MKIFFNKKVILMEKREEYGLWVLHKDHNISSTQHCCLSQKWSRYKLRGYVCHSLKINPICMNKLFEKVKPFGNNPWNKKLISATFRMWNKSRTP